MPSPQLYLRAPGLLHRPTLAASATPIQSLKMAKFRATADPPAEELGGAMLTGETPAWIRDHLCQDSTHQMYSVRGYGHMRPVPPLPLVRLYQER